MADAFMLPLGNPLQFGSMASNSYGQITLDGSSDQAEIIFQAQAPVTITRLGFRVNGRTGTPGNFKISLQGVNTSGNPDGTIKGGGSPASKVFAAGALTAGDWLWHTLDNPYTCTRGEMLSQVVKYDSGTIDGSNSLGVTLCLNQGNSSFNLGCPYSILNDAGSRTRLNNRIPLWGYGTTTRAYGRPLEATATSGNFNASSTPDEVGCKFTVPSGWASTYQVAGVNVDLKSIAGSTIRLRLYDTDGPTVLQEVSYDSDALIQNTQTGLTTLLFDEATLSDLSTGSAYRWTLFQAANNWNVCYLDVDAAADWDAWPFGAGFHWTERTDAGAWTDTTTRKIVGEILLADLTK